MLTGSCLYMKLPTLCTDVYSLSGSNYIYTICVQVHHDWNLEVCVNAVKIVE